MSEKSDEKKLATVIVGLFSLEKRRLKRLQPTSLLWFFDVFSLEQDKTSKVGAISKAQNIFYEKKIEIFEKFRLVQFCRVLL